MSHLKYPKTRGVTKTKNDFYAYINLYANTNINNVVTSATTDSNANAGLSALAEQ